MTTIRCTILGSGTSQGVPAIGCDCETCTSPDWRDSRLRPSALFSVNGKRILIDTSSDFRQQMLKHRVETLTAVLFTHHHFDHIGGFDDIRSYNFIQRRAVNIYATRKTLDELRTTFRYAFDPPEQIGGGVPQVEAHEIPEDPSQFTIDGVAILTVPAMHGALPVLGYRIGNIAYLTDASRIPESSFDLLAGLDALVLNALRHKPHPTHFSLEESIEAARRIGAKKTYFTHIAHNIKHERDSKLLPPGMEFGYDALTVESENEE